jgi:hypothetical protein
MKKEGRGNLKRKGRNTFIYSSPKKIYSFSRASSMIKII